MIGDLFDNFNDAVLMNFKKTFQDLLTNFEATCTKKMLIFHLFLILMMFVVLNLSNL